MKLMKDWGEYDEREVRFGAKGHPNLWCYLPENFIEDLLTSFSEVMKCNPKEHKAFSIDTIIGLHEFCIALIRTDQRCITNPYTKAKALELMTIFVYSDRKGELINEYSKS
jgi:Ubiquitin elongating factor core